MTRPSPVAISVAIAALALVAAACGGTTPSRMTDPTAILGAAATTAEAASSVHLDVGVEGTLAIDLLGAGGGRPIDVSETTAAADIDLENEDLRASVAVPAILNFAADVVLLDDTLYYRTSLTGTDYQMTVLSPPPGPVLDGVIALLRSPDLAPMLGEDEPCAGGTCYAITIDPSAADLAGLGSVLPIPSGLPLPIPDLSTADIGVTVLVEQSTNRLAGLRVTVAGEGVGDLTAEATFTNWDEPVSIEVPEGVQGSG
jgi:hypothetical protein